MIGQLNNIITTYGRLIFISHFSVTSKTNFTNFKNRDTTKQKPVSIVVESEERQKSKRRDERREMGSKKSKMKD